MNQHAYRLKIESCKLSVPYHQKRSGYATVCTARSANPFDAEWYGAVVRCLISFTYVHEVLEFTACKN